MKILSALQTRYVDAFTIESETIESSELMERASVAFVQWFRCHYSLPRHVMVLCGTGNNGGDGLCIARLLQQCHYDVSAIMVLAQGNTSPDFLLNQQRIARNKAVQTYVLSTASNQMPNKFDAPKSKIVLADIATFKQLFSLHHSVLVIDALFGSGLNRPLQGIYAQVVETINESGLEVISVDIPSGLFADSPSASKLVINARHTVSFELPKLAFFMPENYRFVGSWHCVSIGLSPVGIAAQKSHFYYLDALALQKVMHESGEVALAAFQKFAHKGTRGHALLLGGSWGKIGAISMAAGACLCYGAGLTSVYIPACGYAVLQTSLPEVMCLCDPCAMHLSCLPDLQAYKAIGIGVGMGQHPESASALQQLLRSAPCSLVIDADALNIIAQYNWLHLIPKNSILTPHPKEFERLVGKSRNDFERLERLQSLSAQTQSYIALKGAHTAMACPSGQVFFNSTGNPAMASGGSGDVLTGIITAQLALGYSPLIAMLKGVFEHGQAGDRAVKNSATGFIRASDLYQSRLKK